MQLLLPEDLIKKSGSTDPIMYYRRRLGIGRVFRRRIVMGLEMIPQLRVGARILEVIYGAGLVLYNLSGTERELHRLDLDALLFEHDESERWETQHRKLPKRAPFGAALYHVFLLHKRQPLPQSEISTSN